MKHWVLLCLRDRDWRCRMGRILGLALMIGTVAYGRLIMANEHSEARLVVYAFSTQEEVLTQIVFPAFEAAWAAETGSNLTIQGVFGPSGTLAGQINMGAPADVALFSNAQHVAHLKVGRQVRANRQPVVVGHTAMVIVTRPGNPARIAEFSDLTQPGLRLLHADPCSSGAGQWAVLAEYGSALQESGDPATAEFQLEAVWHNVRMLASSARAAMTQFELGACDAFVTYEQDAFLAQDRGIPLEIVVPSRTIVAQHVAVVVDDNVSQDELPVAQAFVAFLVSEAGQRAFDRYHMRSVNVESSRLPVVAAPFTVEDLGGWSQAYAEVVETLWQAQIEPRLDLEPPPGLLDGGP